jgi:hypothetical protein
VAIAEAMHVDGFNADAWAAFATMTGAYALAGVFFALAPFVECEVLAAHCGEVCAFVLAVACCYFFLLFGNDWFPRYVCTR